MEEFIYHVQQTRSIETNDYGVTDIEIGYTALMCPHCFDIIKVYADNRKCIQKPIDVDLILMSNSYFCECPKCGEQADFIELDINMAQIISTLNTKGYYTAYSCEGHLDLNEDLFIRSYIYFYLNDDKDILDKHPLPNGWFIDDDYDPANVFCIHNTPNDIKDFKDMDEYRKYIKEIESIWDKKQLLEDIYKWACGLPDRDTKYKKYQYEFIKMNKEDILNKNADRYIDVINNPRD